MPTIELPRLSNPNIRQWMLNNNILSTKNLHKYYADRILDITRNISVTPIVWQDVWDEKVEVDLCARSRSMNLLPLESSCRQERSFKSGRIPTTTASSARGHRT